MDLDSWWRAFNLELINYKESMRRRYNSEMFENVNIRTPGRRQQGVGRDPPNSFISSPALSESRVREPQNQGRLLDDGEEEERKACKKTVAALFFGSIAFYVLYKFHESAKAFDLSQTWSALWKHLEVVESLLYELKELGTKVLALLQDHYGY